MTDCIRGYQCVDKTMCERECWRKMVAVGVVSPAMIVAGTDVLVTRVIGIAIHHDPGALARDIYEAMRLASFR